MNVYIMQVDNKVKFDGQNNLNGGNGMSKVLVHINECETENEQQPQLRKNYMATKLTGPILKFLSKS